MSKSVYDSNDDGVIDAGALPIGSDVQAWDANLDELATLTYVANRYIGTDGAGNIALLSIPPLISDTDDLTEGAANFYYTEARFDASLGASVVGDFPASIQTSLGLADSATQPADNISTLTNDAGYIDAANLAYTAAPTQGTVTSDAGSNATLPAADVTNAGLLLPSEKTKLTGIETGATADQTGAEIKAAYEAEADTNAFTDAEQSKLAGIEAGAEANNISDADATDLTDGGGTTLHTHLASGISDGTTVGRAVFTAADEAAARGAIDVQPGLYSLGGLTEHLINTASLASNAFQTVLDLSGSHEVVAGQIYGSTPGLRITIDGVITLYDGSAWGRTSGGSLVACIPIPPVQSSTDLKIEIQNLSASSRDYGARIFTR